MRLRTVAALAVGYLLGTRAGRDRYDQIIEAAREGAARLQSGDAEFPGRDALWTLRRRATGEDDGDDGSGPPG